MRVTPKKKADRIARVAEELKAQAVRIIDLKGRTHISDYFVVCTATSDTHAKSITDGVVEEMKGAHHLCARAEGREAGSWILIDYGDVVAHVFLPEAREFYDIEGLWEGMGNP